MEGFTLRSLSHALPRCPTCKGPVIWGRNPHRPFCSLTCRLVDLGVWLDEGYRILGTEGVPPEPEKPSE